MTYEDSIRVENQLLKENSVGIRREDIAWIKKRLLEFHPEWKEFTEKGKLEYYLLSDLNLLLYSINKNKPSDVRDYVERQLKKKEYDEKLKLLDARINPSLLGREKACDELGQEITALLDRAENEFPGFKKARGMMISEMYQKIMAYRTEGAVGHMGILKSIRDEKAYETQKTEKELKKMKKKATTK